MNPRKLWRPKLSMLEESCASCPFREGNDLQFEVVVRRLCKAAGVRFHRGKVDEARFQLHEEAKTRGDFACHHTVYDREDMSLRPEYEHKQCPGAAEHFVREGERLCTLNTPKNASSSPSTQAQSKKLKRSSTTSSPSGSRRTR